MKTTIDISEPIFKAITIRAAKMGQDFDTALNEVLHRGMGIESRAEKLERPVFKRNPVTGHLVITNGRRPEPGTEFTPDQIAQILLEQEVQWHREATGQ